MFNMQSAVCCAYRAVHSLRFLDKGVTAGWARTKVSLNQSCVSVNVFSTVSTRRDKFGRSGGSFVQGELDHAVKAQHHDPPQSKRSETCIHHRRPETDLSDSLYKSKIWGQASPEENFVNRTKRETRSDIVASEDGTSQRRTREHHFRDSDISTVLPSTRNQRQTGLRRNVRPQEDWEEDVFSLKKAKDSSGLPFTQLEPSDIAVIESQTVGQVKEVVTPLEEDSHQAVLLYKEIVQMEHQELLGYVQLNHSRMNHVHFALAMKTLYRVAEAVDDRAQLAVVHAQITEHPGFKVLLSLLALHARDLKPGTAADMVCFMEHYGVDSDEPTMQVFLQLAKFFINDLTLDRVVQVAVAVGSMTPSRQTETLLAGLRVLVGLRTNSQNLETLTPFELVHMFNLFFVDLVAEQRDKLFSLLLEAEPDLEPQFSVLLLDGLRKASRDLQIRSPRFAESCVVKLEELFASSKLSAEETTAAVEALSELGLGDSVLLNALTQNLLTTKQSDQEDPGA